MTRFVPLILFLVLVVGGGWLIGANTAPGEWYDSLEKPAFNPPGWLFAPVWTVLYILIAVAGWRTWMRKDTGGAMTIWWAQLGLNFLWSPLFFALQMPVAALIVIIALLLTIIMFIRTTWHPDRVSAFLFVPYLAWVAFASLLNASIVVLN
ncbi:TspO/MBR family protein [Aquamicrobium zhengzhouense]|uniref:Tryptophan-rich sensory protein n=1 Tax=Aquamicrobium zhengzhouense TaxID=2781738 RepID=A0ABS0SFH0_9HYPH|nr:TspO/MBR family protein [Aquamicrobium zhengzhouense]MBI1621173.1 tryptophan-rich sensory protein [Aquamicrobium zhengzhouense]